MAEGILGNTAQTLAKRMAGQYGEVLMPSSRNAQQRASASVSISVTVDTKAIAAASQKVADGAMETVCSAMDKGIAKIQSLKSIVG